MFLSIAFSGAAQNNYTGATNGNWSVAGNWSAGVPTTAQTVTIPDNKNVVIDVAAVCAGLTISGGGNNNTITVSGTNSLTVSGTITIASPTGGTFGINQRAKIINVAAGTVTCGALSMADNSSALQTCQVNISTGKLSVLGNITMAGALTEDSITISGNGILEIGGAMPNTSGCFSLSSTSTVRYTGSNQNVFVKGYVTVGIPVAADLIYGNIEFLNGGTKTALGNFNLNGNWTNNATFAPATSTIGFIGGSATQTIGGTSATTFNNLSILRPEPTTLANNVTVTGTLALGGLDPSLSLVDGQLDVADRILTLTNAVTAGDGSFDNEDMIIASGTGQVRRLYAGTGSYTFPIGDNTGTVEYSPITVNVTAGTFSGAYVGVSVVDAKHPNNASSTNFITRYWNVIQSGITGAVATVTGSCVTADISGATTAISTGQLSGTFNQSTNPWKKFAAFSGNNFTATGAILTAGVTSAFTGITKAAPSVSVSGGGTFCQDSAVTLTANPVGDTTFIYSWSNSLGSGNTASPSTTAAGTSNYSVTATDGNGFTATANTNVTVNAKPTFGAVQVDPVCDNSTASVSLSGLLPDSTSTITYTIDAGAPQTVTGVLASASGKASFNLLLALANNDQQLSITNITRTDVAPTCPFVPDANATPLTVFKNVTYYADADADGFGNASVTQVSCVGAPDGYILDDSDCNDAVVYYQDSDNDGFGSSVKLACGTITNNSDCDDSVVYYQDNDNDGFGSTVKLACGTVTNNSDCNDSVVYYQDSDNDGFGSSVKLACGTITNNSDCDDSVVYYQDNDSDGFGSIVKLACGTVTNNSDCNDSVVYYQDLDNDGYGSDIRIACGTVTVNTDCNDNEPSAHPGAVEIGYDLIDNDCDGLVDEGFPPKVTTLMTVQCGTTLPAIDSPLYADIVAGAQGYRWRITTMIGGTTPGIVQFLDTSLRVMRITQLAQYAFNTTYRVEVAVYFSGHLQPYQASSCIVSTPATTTQLVSCGASITSMSDVVYANLVPFATGYRFRISDPANPLNVQEINRNLREFRMNLVNAFTVQFGKTYNVECAIKNTDGTYLPYGSVCTVTTPLFPSTSIQELQCQDGSSGNYNVPNNYTLIYADSYPGAVSYAFKLTGPGLPVNGAVVVKSLRAFALNDFAGSGIIAGATYNISVRLIFNFSDVAGPYGKVCTLTTPGLSRNVSPELAWDATASPNPFSDSFNITASGHGSADVNIYDMTGRLLETQHVEELETFKAGARYPSGVYNVIVHQGDNVKTLRVVKR